MQNDGGFIGKRTFPIECKIIKIAVNDDVLLEVDEDEQKEAILQKNEKFKHLKNMLKPM